MNYTDLELKELGIKIGKNVSVHKTVQFFNPHKISLGSNVRVDCFSLVSASEEVIIGDYVHIASGVFLFGASGIEISDYCSLSSRVMVYSATDSFTGGFLVGPTVNDDYRNVYSAKVTLKKYAVVGAGSVIMPGVCLEEGAAIGAMSFVKKSVPAFSIMAGNPLRKLGLRNEDQIKKLAKAHRTRNGI